MTHSSCRPYPIRDLLTFGQGTVYTNGLSGASGEGRVERLPLPLLSTTETKGMHPMVRARDKEARAELITAVTEAYRVLSRQPIKGYRVINHKTINMLDALTTSREDLHKEILVLIQRLDFLPNEIREIRTRDGAKLYFEVYHFLKGDLHMRMRAEPCHNDPGWVPNTDSENVEICTDVVEII